MVKKYWNNKNRVIRKQTKTLLHNLISTIIILIILVMFFVSGCTSGSNKNKTKGEIKGGKSVDFRVILPSDDIYDNPSYTYDVSVEIENYGKFDAQGVVSIYYVPNQIVFSSSVKRYTIESAYSPGVPSKKRLLFTFHPMPLIGTESLTSKIVVTNCFDYVTELNEIVCIDSLLDTKKEGKVCEVKDISTSGQGAPVTIPKVEVKMMPITENSAQPVFVVHVRNSGGGEISAYGASYSLCTYGAVTRPLIKIEAYLDTTPLICQPNVLFYEGKGGERSNSKSAMGNKFICTGPTFINENRDHFLTIRLYYGYMQKKQKTIRIIKIVP